jgi:hypothetical protein
VTTVFHGVSIPVAPVGSQLLFLVDRLIDTFGDVRISTKVVEVVFFAQPTCFINITWAWTPPAYPIGFYSHNLVTMIRL